jgi:hypothetical protein
MVQLDVGGTSPWYNAVTVCFMFNFGGLLYFYPFSKCTERVIPFHMIVLKALLAVLLLPIEFTSIHLTVIACNLHKKTWGHVVVI